MNLSRPLCALLLLGAVVEIAGCKSLLKKRDPEAAPSAAPIAAPPPPAVLAPPPTPSAAAVAEAPPAAAVDENAVPTPQDFEDEAFEKVTPANFRAQFTQLKTDIGK